MELAIIGVVLSINTVMNTINMFQFKQLINRIERLESPYFNNLKKD